jgi:hypothetical protein
LLASPRYVNYQKESPSMSQLVMSIQRIGVGVLLVSLMLLSSVEARNLQDDWPDLNTGRITLETLSELT